MKRFLFSSVLASAAASLVCSSPGRDLPEPGDERPMKDPFTPYDIGVPSAAWAHAELTAEEQAAADRGPDVGGSRATHDAFGAAGAELAVKAAAAAATAAQRPGTAGRGATGVGP